MIRDYYDYQDAMRQTLRVPPEKKAVPEVGGIQREYGLSLAQKANEAQAQALKEKKEMAQLWQDKKDLDRFASANTIANIVSAGNIGVEVAGGLANQRKMDRTRDDGLAQTIKTYDQMKAEYQRGLVDSEAIRQSVLEEIENQRKYRAFLNKTGQAT
jgi:hypothetical protein